jgi:DNA-binding beta-propeller fold protein YncE/mono/diheme cytochrome c family protein
MTMRGQRLGIGAIVCAAVVAACGGGAQTTPKAPTEAKKSVAPQPSRACTAPGSGKGAKPLGAPHVSSTVALATSGNQTIAYVADEDAQTVQTVDVDTGAEIASTALEGKPAQLLVMPDGRVVVAIRNQAKVQVLEPGDRTDAPLTAKCAVDTAAEPISLALTPDDKTLLVASGWGATLTGLTADVLTKKFETGLAREPRAVVSSDDGKTAFVSHASGSKMSVVDLENGTKKTEIVLRGRDPSFGMQMKSMHQQIERMRAAKTLTPEIEKSIAEEEKRMLASQTRPAVQGYALAKSIDPPGRILAPQVFADPGDPQQRAEGYGHDGASTETPSVAVIDEGKAQPFDASLLFSQNRFFSGGPDDPRDHHDPCLLPRAAAVDAKNRTLLVTCFGMDELVSYDAAAANPSVAEKRRWRVGGGPSGVAVDPVKHRAVVFAQFDRSITVVSLDHRDVTDEKKFPPPAPVKFALAPLKTPLNPQIQLGRLLFHNANDSRIARDGRACASCHPDGRDDSITWATPLGPRRSLFLAGRVADTAPYSWLGAEKSLHEHLATTFDRLSGQGLRSLELDAIVAYITTLAPPNEGVVRRDDDAKKIARGKEIFTSGEAECSSCHTPSTNFTDGKVHDVKSKTESDKAGAFNTPSLKGCGGAGPWFHDGRYATLKELIKSSDGKMGKTKQLSDADVDALESYLRTL